jgi:HK97 family phage major capsid protein
MTTKELKQNWDFQRNLLKKALDQEVLSSLEPVLESITQIIDTIQDVSDKAEMLETIQAELDKIKETLGTGESGETETVVSTIAQLRKKLDEHGKKSITKKTIKEAVNEELKKLGNFTNINTIFKIGDLQKSFGNSKKAVNGVTLTGETIPIPEFWGVIEEIILSGDVSRLINIGHTNMMNGSVRATKESSTGDIAQQVNLGDVKGEIQVNYDAFDVPMKTFAGWVRCAKQILNDVGWLENAIINLISRKVKRFWEAYLFGVASSTGTLYDGTTLANSIANPQIADAIFTLATQLRKNGFNGKIAAVLNPIDLASIRTIKDTNGNYINVDTLLAGIERLEEPNQPVNQVTVGDFDFINALVNMSEATARIFEQDADNVTRNLVTLRTEFFGCAWIDNDDAFITSNIQSVIDAIDKVTPAP